MSTTKHTRLLAPKPERTEYDHPDDALAALVRQCEQKLDEIPDPPYDLADGENERKSQAWADVETGALCRMVALHGTIDKMAAKLHRTPAGVKQKLYDLRRVLGVKSQAQYGAMSGIKRKGDG